MDSNNQTHLSHVEVRGKKYVPLKIQTNKEEGEYKVLLKHHISVSTTLLSPELRPFSLL